MDQKIPKKMLARSLGVSRSSLYYIPKQPSKDAALRDQILDTLTEHPAYGHRRIALALDTGKNRIYRVMLKYGIKPRVSHKRPRYGRNRSLPDPGGLRATPRSLS